MRTNIVIDPALLDAAMKAGPYTTKKEAVEAGLKLLARQAAYREILKWEGKLLWEGDESIDWTQPRPPASTPLAASTEVVEESTTAQEPTPGYAPARSTRGRRAGR
jgi:Arc/MetJ family transcription regulator